MLRLIISFVCGRIEYRRGEKFCRVHKNQAVNLLQIPIHEEDDPVFVDANVVKFNESRITAQFEGSAR